MKVEIISGTYGRKVNGAIEPVHMGDTCEVDEAEANRLISLGVAKACPESTQEAATDVSDGQTVEHSSDTENGEDADAESSEEYSDDEVIELERDGNMYSFSRKSLEDMTMADIRELAKDVGMENVGSYNSKRALIDALVAYSFEIDDAPDPDVEDVVE